MESIVSQAVKPFVELHDTMSGHAKRLTKLRLVMMRDQISLLKKQNELIAKEKIEKEKFVELRKTCMKRAQKNLSEKKLLLTDMKKLITGLLQSYEQVGKEVEAKQRSLLAEYFSFLPVCRLNESYCSVFHICIPNNLSLQKLFDGISGSNAKAAQNTATWLPAALYNILPSFALKSDLLNSEVREIFAPSLPFLIVSESKPDPEVNYTCWGYISYILKSISAYLNIHLPYEMNFLSSRSIIMDRSKKSFPLYYCPNTAFLTQESTLHALSLLNSNISVIFDFVKKTSLHNSSESDWNVVIGQHSFILRLVFLLQMIKMYLFSFCYHYIQS